MLTKIITNTEMCYFARISLKTNVPKFVKINSVTVVQRHFRTWYGKQPPTRQSIYDWSKKFNETVVCARGEILGDHMYPRKQRLVFVRLACGAQRSRKHVQV
jgi:hypothetical protein